MNFLEYHPVTNSLLAIGLFGLGIVNTIFIVLLIGRAIPSKHPNFLRWAHRITGYIFFAFYLFISAVMFKKLSGINYLPPKGTIHAYIGSSIFLLIIIKICINRFFKKFYNRLPMYGVLILFAVYFQVALYAALYLYSALFGG
ncbi:MAG: hypothetical protein E3K32_09910 [wastewater metagenome]|nr:hypothetical protein [Candidatus Loosdrechtia aerotolerans]